MPIVKDKSIFVPTAHDEPFLYTKPYENIFSIPKFIMYNTNSEKNLIENIFKNHTKNSDVSGIGIENYSGFLEALPDYLMTKKYFIYVGRIDKAKGCDVMLNNFIEFKKKYPEYHEYKLVLVGKYFMNEQYHHSSIIYTGFISEEMKYTFLKNSLAIIMPSLYESLSLATLEAMIERIPIIVNKNCDVLYNHVLDSKTGKTFSSKEEFFQALKNYIHINSSDLEKEGEKAREYVLKKYSWKKVLEKFDNAIDFTVNK